MKFGVNPSIAVLERTPATLRALLDGLPEGWTQGNEGPDTFSPFDVVGHLIDGEETDWIPRARIILARQPEGRFSPYDRFRHRTRNAGRSRKARKRFTSIVRLERHHRASSDGVFHFGSDVTMLRIARNT